MKTTYVQKFNLKETLHKANKSGYWLAKEIERPVSQIYAWLKEENPMKMSNLTQDFLIAFLQRNNIEIIK